MKKYIYPLLFICISALAFNACKNDGTAYYLMVNARDTTQVVVYAGSPTGGQKVDFGTNTDSIQKALVSKHFGSKYDPELYAYMKIDFSGDILTYVDSAASKKIVSTYLFSNDSLYVNKTGGGKTFVALGTRDNLYRIKGFAHSISSSQSASDTVYVTNYNVGDDNIGNVVGYTVPQMTDSKDTLVFATVKYLFR